VLNIISIAIAMQRIFALTKKKIFQNIYQQFRNSIAIIARTAINRRGKNINT